MQRGIEDRQRDRGVRAGPVPAGDPPAGEPGVFDLPHRSLPGRAVRAVDRDPLDRRAVRPRHRNHARQDRNRPAYGADHHHVAAAAADPRWRPDRPAADRLRGRPRTLHDQPDQLRPVVVLGDCVRHPPARHGRPAHGAPIDSRFQSSPAAASRSSRRSRSRPRRTPRVRTARACM